MDPPRRARPIRMLLLLLAAPLLAAGCLSGAGDGAGLAGAAETAGAREDAAGEALSGPTAVARKESSGTTVEFSALCEMGEGPELAREALIGEDAQRLRFTVEPGVAAGGIRLGYALDGGEITWLPVVTGLPASFDVDVPADAIETSGPRWSFHYQPNLPGPAAQECYTGVALGSHRLLVEALPTV